MSVNVNNFLIDEEKIRGSRIVFLQKVAENTIGQICKQLNSFKESGNEKETFTYNWKTQLKSIGYIIRKVCSENLTLTGNVSIEVGKTGIDLRKEFVQKYDRRGSL